MISAKQEEAHRDLEKLEAQFYVEDDRDPGQVSNQQISANLSLWMGLILALQYNPQIRNQIYL
jgi:hypothetical protein